MLVAVVVVIAAAAAAAAVAGGAAEPVGVGAVVAGVAVAVAAAALVAVVAAAAAEAAGRVNAAAEPVEPRLAEPEVAGAAGDVGQARGHFGDEQQGPQHQPYRTEQEYRHLAEDVGN